MNLELKRLQVELIRVQGARSELELKIMERQEEMSRIQAAIAAQDKREGELLGLIAAKKEEV
jgi:hypothetical protein